MGAAHVGTDRTVLTYEIHGQPVGCLTGYTLGDRFVVEHVVAFPDAPTSTLAHMLSCGVQEAWRRDYKAIQLCVMSTHPLAGRLLRVSHALGFTEYNCDAEKTWLVRWRH